MEVRTLDAKAMIPSYMGKTAGASLQIEAMSGSGADHRRE
jgi:hypothetical protein